MESPIVFKKNLPKSYFVGTELKLTQDTSLGNVKLSNLLSVKVRVTSLISEVGHIRLRVSGRTDETEPTNNYLSGFINGEKFTTYKDITEEGTYTIVYDISNYSQAWLWFSVKKLITANCEDVAYITAVDYQGEASNLDILHGINEMGSKRGIKYLLKNQSLNASSRHTITELGDFIKINLSFDKIEGTNIPELYCEMYDSDGNIFKAADLVDQYNTMLTGLTYSSTIKGYYKKFTATGHAEFECYVDTRMCNKLLITLGSAQNTINTNLIITVLDYSIVENALAKPAQNIENKGRISVIKNGSGTVKPVLDVSSFQFIRIDLSFENESGATIPEFYCHQYDVDGNVDKVMDLLDDKGKLLDGLSYSSSIVGYFKKLYDNNFVAYVDVRETNNIRLTLSGGGINKINMHCTPLYYSIVENNLIQDSPDEILYRGRNFSLKKTKIAISDCYMNTYVSLNSDSSSIRIFADGLQGGYKDVALNSSNFPNLKGGSRIYRVMVLPYTRGGGGQIGRSARICVVTTKNQVYHNYPSRSTGISDEGVSLSGDVYLFDQSVLWDLPINKTARRHPSNNPNESRTGFRYDPTLTDYAYNLDPAMNVDNGYANGGFPDQITVNGLTRPRYYDPFEKNSSAADAEEQVDSFFRILSYPCKSRKCTFIGTYQIRRCRVTLWGTSDGGRNWCVMDEFASNIGYGNKINTTMLGDYTANSFSIAKRNLVTPSAENKEPSELFAFGNSIKVTSISKGNPAVVTTATAHGLSNKDVFILRKDSDGSPDYEFMSNNSASPTSAGNGMFYMAKRLTTTTFELYEYIYSPDNNLGCRHIHYVNLLKDFISYGTGETYPNGWIMLLENKLKDATANIDLRGLVMNKYRLNSSPNGLQRLCSFWMLDDDTENPTVFAGLDEVGVPRDKLKIQGRTDLPSRSSAGVFVGKLSDIDDMSKFKSVLDVEDVNIYMVDANGILIVGFMCGYCAISFDKGFTWDIINVGGMLSFCGVDMKNTLYFDDNMKLELD